MIKNYDKNNIFAKILRGEIPCKKILESEHSLAFYDVNPQTKIHALVVPKGAYISFADFSERASDAEIAGYIRDIGETARKIGVEENGYRLLSNHGANARQEVAHLHIHICGGEKLGRMITAESE